MKAFRVAPGPRAILAFDGLRVLDVNDAFTAATAWRREEVVSCRESESKLWDAANCTTSWSGS